MSWRKIRNPRGRADGLIAFAVCDHFYTVHVNRLRPFRTPRGSVVYPRVSPGDLKAISKAVQAALATLLSHHVEAKTGSSANTTESVEAERKEAKAAEPEAASRSNTQTNGRRTLHLPRR